MKVLLADCDDGQCAHQSEQSRVTEEMNKLALWYEEAGYSWIAADIRRALELNFYPPIHLTDADAHTGKSGPCNRGFHANCPGCNCACHISSVLIKEVVDDSIVYTNAEATQVIDTSGLEKTQMIPLIGDDLADELGIDPDTYTRNTVELPQQS